MAGVLRRTRLLLRPDHAKVTAGVSRESQLHLVRIARVEQETKDVKTFYLQPHDAQVSLPNFKAGQWLDVHLPNEMIGGFSIASSPSECVKTDELMMSIKYSQHPPAHYMHHTASVGNVLPVRVGGDVYYDPKKQRRLLLIAGGIGITPLRAIMAQATSTPATIASLMYSATSFEDVLYKPFLRACQSRPLQSVSLYLTQSLPEDASTARWAAPIGARIDQAAIAKELKRMANTQLPTHMARLNWQSDVDVHVCGPPPMVDTVALWLQQLGQPADRVHYERWW